MRISSSVLIATLFSALLLAGCQPMDDAQASATPPPPAPPIDVATVVKAPVMAWSQFTTRLEATEEVELRPRISGVIESIEFTEGGLVQAGDLLVKLDDRPFVAEVARLKAQREAARAALRQAQSEANRAASLRRSNAISAEQAEARLSLAAQRRAELAAVEAQLVAAELNLEFTEIRAPISGRVSRAFITAGNTVRASETVLTSLVSTDYVHAYFDVDERSWNRKFADISANGAVAAHLQLAGETGFTQTGVLDFIDNRVNPNTGTLRVRATFSANQATLRPGAFARVRIAPGQQRPSILVPERAIGTDLKNRFVLVVNADNQLEYRRVIPGNRVGVLRVIEKGLHKGDRIAVNGAARVGPGMVISPRDVQISTADLPDTVMAAGA
ncbi:MAG: efflux RND transporter periplasmic adaptor subunit [Marinobacterium sp.]|nr:efflux RND transporter periplasmic adaptor subunit [Marinobacterium sp.]